MNGVNLGDPDVKGLVDRIFWARFAQQVRATGMDPEDGLQEVYKGLLGRNRGKRPWSPEVSSLSNYVFIVTTSVVRNIADSQRRAKRRGWQVGVGEDVATWDKTNTQGFNGLTVRRLAERLGAPESVVLAFANGEDPWDAALAAGLSLPEITGLVARVKELTTAVVKESEPEDSTLVLFAG